MSFGEEFALDTVQRSNHAVIKDARTMSFREEFALDTVQRSNHAVIKDVRTMPCREEFVIATVLKSKGARWSLQKTLWSIEVVDRVVQVI